MVASPERTQTPPEDHPLAVGVPAPGLPCGMESEGGSSGTEQFCPFEMLSSTSSSSEIGDYIGMESCLDLEDDEEVCVLKAGEESRSYGKCHGKRERRLAMKKKEFPPPIPLLARTGNLPSRMPWVLKRSYADGRLILTEERVRHHEYFRAHRANGRLTLQLVPLDDDFWPPSCSDEDESGDDEDKEPETNPEEDEEPHDTENESDDGVEVEKEIVVDDSATNGAPAVAVNGAGKCLNYNNVAAGTSCIFGVPVPAIRTIHS